VNRGIQSRVTANHLRGRVQANVAAIGARVPERLQSLPDVCPRELTPGDAAAEDDDLLAQHEVLGHSVIRDLNKARTTARRTPRNEVTAASYDAARTGSPSVIHRGR